MKQNWLLNWTVHSIYEEAGIARDKERSAILEKYGLISNSVFQFGGMTVDFQGGLHSQSILAVKERTKA